MPLRSKRFNALPGFGLSMGFTLLYLSAIVLIPFAGLVIRACGLSWADFWRLATTERALAAYNLTFGASLIAGLANALFGTLLALVLVRDDFPGRRLIDAMVDFPFALPTAVAGLTLASLFAANGRSEEHTSELQSQSNLVCRLLLEKKNKQPITYIS